jgi:hypothetical protein
LDRRTITHGSGGGWTDGQLNMAVEGVGQTIQHGSVGSWMDGRTGGQTAVHGTEGSWTDGDSTLGSERR